MKKVKVKTKVDLLEAIDTAHRQLERYIFYFEREEQGGGFSASGRPRLGRDEMIQPGAWGKWSLKDLLVYVAHSEQRVITLLEGKGRETLASPLLLSLNWEQRLDPDVVSQAVDGAELDEVLVNFPVSYRAMVLKLEKAPQEMLFTPGAHAWTGEHAAADFIHLLAVDLYDWVKSLVRRWNKRHSGEQLNKGVILERIRTERRRLEMSLRSIPREAMQMSGVVGEWSVKDLLAHLVEWERMFTGWYQAGVGGEVPEVPAPGYSWREMDALNEHIYRKHRDRTLEQVLEDFAASYDQVYALVEGMTEEEMFASGRYAWMGKGSLVSYILANTASHYRWAKDTLRAWSESAPT